MPKGQKMELTFVLIFEEIDPKSDTIQGTFTATQKVKGKKSK
jgi:hypothetical protein